MKRITYLLFPLLLILVIFFAFQKEAHAQQSSCQATINPTQVNENTRTQISASFNIPPAVPQAARKTCVNNQRPCLEIWFCLYMNGSCVQTSDQEVNGPLGTPTFIDNTPNNNETNVYDVMRGSKTISSFYDGAESIHYWLVEVSDGGSRVIRCSENAANLTQIVHDNTIQQAQCQDGIFSATKAGSQNSIITIADQADLHFDGSKASNFKSAGVYDVWIRKDGQTYSSDLHAYGTGDGHLTFGHSLTDKQSSGVFASLGPFTTQGHYEVVIQDIAGTNIYCNPFVFSVDPGDGSIPPTDPNQYGNGQNLTGGNTSISLLRFDDFCRFAGGEGTEARTNCDTCAQLNKGVWTPFGCIEAEPQKFVEKILRLSIAIAGGIAFLMMAYASITILTSTNNPEKLNHGKEIFYSAIAGLLLIIFSAVILKIIGVDILQIPGFS